MKKIILTFVISLFCFSAFAQKDTLLFNPNGLISFKKEVTTNLAGKQREEYFVIYSDKTTQEHVVYVTDKTSYKRYKLYERFDVMPIYAIVLDEKTKTIKVIIL